MYISGSVADGEQRANHVIRYPQQPRLVLVLVGTLQTVLALRRVHVSRPHQQVTTKIAPGVPEPVVE